MYTKFYNLKEKPFEITPDPSFLYLSENHREALAHLTYAVQEKKGFTVITGEVGTGKTTLIHTLLSRLDGNTRTAYLFNPKLVPTDFLHYICEDFGLKSPKRSKGQHLTQLHNFLMTCYSQNERAVLIIDEAQNLDSQLLEEVRLLTNLETPKSKLLQVILIGQPELNDMLSQRQCRQLKQRVSLRYHVHPLNKKETEEYISQRLKKAGAVDVDLFTPKAFDKIYQYSKGIPRSINIVCDNALLAGYATDQKIVGEKIIREVIDHLEGMGVRQRRSRRRLAPPLVALLGMLCLGVLFLLWGEEFWQAGKSELIAWLQTVQRLMERVYQDLWEKVFRLFP